MPATLSFVNASLTSSSLFGRMIALISFIRSPFENCRDNISILAVSLHERKRDSARPASYILRDVSVERRVSMRRVLLLSVICASAGPHRISFQGQKSWATARGQRHKASPASPAAGGDADRRSVRQQRRARRDAVPARRAGRQGQQRADDRAGRRREPGAVRSRRPGSTAPRSTRRRARRSGIRSSSR